VLLLIAIPATVVAALCLWRISGLLAKLPVPYGDGRRQRWWPLWVAGVVVAVLAATEGHVPASARDKSSLRLEALWTAQFDLDYEIYGPGGRTDPADYDLIDHCVFFN
jgi:hypothetical protein